MADLLIMEAVNLFCGDADPTKSKHLSLAELKLPTLEEVMQEHSPGGGKMQIDIGMGVIKKLEPTFKLAGWDPDVMAKFGLGSAARQVYTARGVLRSRRSGVAQAAVAVFEARLGKIEAEAFKRGELQHHDHALYEVMHYELSIDGVEKYYADFFTNAWRVDGIDRFAEENRILGIV